MNAIATGAPIWVWPLLASLLFLGLRSSRTRMVPAGLVYAMPILGLLSLHGLAGLHPAPQIWLTFALAYLTGCATGLSLGRSWIIGRDGNRLHIKGEWLTLAQVLVIFLLNFITGYLRAVAPAVLIGFAFPAGFALIAGLSAGLFAGRALAAWQTRTKTKQS